MLFRSWLQGQVVVQTAIPAAATMTRAARPRRVLVRVDFRVVTCSSVILRHSFEHSPGHDRLPFSAEHWCLGAGSPILEETSPRSSSRSTCERDTPSCRRLEVLGDGNAARIVSQPYRCQQDHRFESATGRATLIHALVENKKSPRHPWRPERTVGVSRTRRFRVGGNASP